MASTWSDNLKIELLGTGDTNWGTLTNNNFKWALEESITGYGIATFPSDADYDWGAGFTNSNSSQAQRNLVIRVTGTISTTRNLIVPLNSAGTAPIEKQYIFWNDTTGGQAIVVKTPSGTGVTIPNGVRMHVFVDGTNVVQMSNYDVSRTVGTLSLTNALSAANGGTGVTALGTGVATALGQNVTGSGGIVLATNPTIDRATFTGNAQTTPFAVSFSATAMTLDCTESNVFTTTFTANVTVAPTISNPQNGQTINWFITQDGTGGRTMTWPSSFKWADATTPQLSTAANAVDLLVATYLTSTSAWYATLSKGFA